ncbi:NAD-dependent succinate-semialdehyde dehydrogenase [Flocculibacter collagenilyticus]|uniref:NAD-dependent succinate-semialdehyde dehydrogenase n=1 Tax=Flocculibacter collagenilyticus TaxID=2744479 RepID=UPI0018F79EF3|nr:NAD-dependent succinate-semialdehyde dehydrogenase [Flocculibacter collagenilyticus]
MSLNLSDNSLLNDKLYINGEWQNTSLTPFNVLNPATGDVIATVANAGEEHAKQAIAAATDALPAWQHKTAKERSSILRKWFELIMENQEDLARIMTAEQGKPLEEARGEIAYGASFIEWFAEEGKRVYGDITPTNSPSHRLVTIKQAVGVVAAITPWNFPSAMLTRKAGPALAAGCTFVMKPASETPLSAIALAVLAERAGIPKGVLNLIISDDSKTIGDVFTSDTRVKKITFTGSTAIGKTLLKQSADTVKKASMELGGNAPLVVFADADLDSAVEGAVASRYRNAGQTCICVNRMLVQDEIYDEFTKKLTEKVASMKVDNGFADNVDIGPLINIDAVLKVEKLVNEAVEEGAQVLAGGERSNQGECYFQPTVLGNVTKNMNILSEEIFGPVSPVVKFSTEEEAIEMANDTNYGLAAYIYTQNLGRAWRVSEAIEYGMVGVNEVSITSELIPFGGVKESGLGREGSKYGIDEYVDIKYICMGGV